MVNNIFSPHSEASNSPLQQNRPSKKDLQERAGKIASTFILMLREEEKINIAEYRKYEPDIDLMLNIIVDEIFSFSWYKDKKSVIENDFILDDEARSFLKRMDIVWLPYSHEELAEKIGDLFYEPLAGLLYSLASKIEKQIDSDEEVIKLLQEASTHILNAWKHCKPYVLDVEALKRNSKHTFEIEWSGFNNQELAKAIAFLENEKLKELLWLLSSKIQRDAEADKWRGRLKLAWELFATAEKLNQASEKII